MRTFEKRNKTRGIIIVLALAITVGFGLQSCEGLFPDEGKKTPEEKARQDSITVASTRRYGDPNVIITDKSGNPIPGPDGSPLRAGQIPTNPNIKFPVLDSIASMAKTLGLPAPAKGQILYGISHGDDLAVLDFNQLFYDYDENDKTLSDWGTITARNFMFKENGREYHVGVGTWVDGRPGVFVQDDTRDHGYSGDARVYIKTKDRVEIYDYGSEKLIGYLEKGSKPNTYKRVMYETGGPILRSTGANEPIEEEIEAGFIFIDPPEDDPSQSLAYFNNRGERTLMTSFYA